MDGVGVSVFFEYYKIFYFVAKTGNITGAARLLSVTQPSVTKSIRSLEKQLGCSLFVRSKKGVELTREGSLLFRKIQPACELIFSAEADLDDLRQMKAGIMRIGANELTFTSWLLPHVKTFKQKYPDVRIKIENITIKNVMEVLDSGTIDFAVLSSPVGVEDEKHSLIFRPDIELSSVDQIAKAVKESLGIGFLPEKVAKPAIDEGILQPISLAEPIPMRYNCILTVYNNPPSITARTFIDQFRDMRPLL